MGNPTDATLALPMLERQKAFYGRPPRQVAMDGGFASNDNLKGTKTLELQDVCFQEARGLKISERTTLPYLVSALTVPQNPRFRTGSS